MNHINFITLRHLLMLFLYFQNHTVHYVILNSVISLLGYLLIMEFLKQHPVGSTSNKQIVFKEKQQRPFTVVVEGNIGSGKTTFLEILRKNEMLQVITEPVEEWRNIGGHNLLKLSYENPTRWSYLFHSLVQLTMTKNHLLKIPSTKQIKIMERSLFSNRYCFTKLLHDTGKLLDSEFVVLCEWFDFIANGDLIQGGIGIDLIIYLKTSPTIAFGRANARARKEENMVPLKYFEQLHYLHEKWLSNTEFLPAPVLIIDANVDVKEFPNAYNKYETEILQ